MPQLQPATIGNVRIGGGAPLALIAGPCVIESRDHTLFLAEAIQKICVARKLNHRSLAQYLCSNDSDSSR